MELHPLDLPLAIERGFQQPFLRADLHPVAVLHVVADLDAPDQREIPERRQLGKCFLITVQHVGIEGIAPVVREGVLLEFAVAQSADHLAETLRGRRFVIVDGDRRRAA